MCWRGLRRWPTGPMSTSRLHLPRNMGIVVRAAESAHVPVTACKNRREDRAMHLRLLAPITLLTLLQFSVPALAQQPMRKVKLDDRRGVQIGFRGAGTSDGFKNGFWTPVL